MKEATKKKEEIKPHPYKDLLKYTNPNIYSSLGQIKQSIKLSSPQYSFNLSSRYDQSKKYYSNKFNQIYSYGQHTPNGPNYNPSDQFLFNKSPSYKIGTQSRNTLDTKAKYQHYLRKDIIDINEADRAIRQKQGSMRFGGSPRFPSTEKCSKLTPGPQYDPVIKPQAASPSKFSFAARRAVKGYDPLISLSSTSEVVGPGLYYPEKVGSMSNKFKNNPNWSLSKAPRDPLQQNNSKINQTYNVISSIGSQYQSQKQTKPHYSMGKQKRGENKSGVFLAHMQFKPSPIRIKIPDY